MDIDEPWCISKLQKEGFAQHTATIYPTPTLSFKEVNYRIAGNFRDIYISRIYNWSGVAWLLTKTE